MEEMIHGRKEEGSNGKDECVEADVPGADTRRSGGAEGRRKAGASALGTDVSALGRHLLREGERHREADRGTRGEEQAGRCGGSRLRSSRQDAASSCAALSRPR